MGITPGVSLIVLIGLLAFIGMIIIVMLGRIFRKVPPNVAMIVTGLGRRKIVIGGGAIVVPLFQRVDFLPLETRMVEIRTTDILTKDNVKVEIDAIALVKVDTSSEEAVTAAAERFLGKSEEEFISMVREVFEGRTREVVAEVTMDELLHQRDKIAENIKKVTGEDLQKMGLILDSYTIKDIKEDQGYIDALNQAIIAQAKAQSKKEVAAREAEMEQAEAEKRKKVAQYQKEADIEEARNRAEAEQQKSLYEAEVRIKQSEYQAQANIKQAEYEAQTRIAQAQAQAEAEAKEAEFLKTARIARAQAEAEAKEREAEAEKRAQIAKLEAEMAVAEERKAVEMRKAEADMAYSITEKQKMIELQQLEIERKQRELEANVKKPAEAERYKVEQMAEAERAKQIAIAQAQAEKIRLQGLAEAEIEKARGLAEAEATKAKGMAEAEIIEARGLAEAKAMMNKAQAWKQYNQAAIVDIIINKMPDIAKAMAEPLTKIDKIIMVSGDGAGPSKLAKDVASTVATLPEIVKQLSGVDITELLKHIPTSSSQRK